MTEAIRSFEYDQRRARDARSEARQLRDLYQTATCGLRMQHNGIHYGTREVPSYISRRVVDCYLLWADEYDAIADEIEADLASRLA